MRYAGQGWEIPVALTPDQAASRRRRDTCCALFEADYAQLFGRSVEGMDVEITRLVGQRRHPAGRRSSRAGAGRRPARTAARQAPAASSTPPSGRTVEAAVYDRDSLAPGARVCPARPLITERETTIVVTASRIARVLAGRLHRARAARRQRAWLTARRCASR